MKNPVTGRYQIDGPAEAAWVVAQVGRARQQKAAVIAAGREAKARYDAWVKTTNAPLDTDDVFFTTLAAEWIESLIPAQLRSDVDSPAGELRWAKYNPKTIKTPTGNIWVKRTAGRYEVVEPDAYRDFLVGALPDPVADAWTAAIEQVRAVAALVGVTLSLVPSAPPIDHGSYSPDRTTGEVRYRDPDGELVPVPGLRYRAADLTFGVTPAKELEHPAWNPAPEGSDLPDHAPEPEPEPEPEIPAWGTHDARNDMTPGSY